MFYCPPCLPSVVDQLEGERRDQAGYQSGKKAEITSVITANSVGREKTQALFDRELEREVHALRTDRFLAVEMSLWTRPSTRPTIKICRRRRASEKSLPSQPRSIPSPAQFQTNNHSFVMRGVAIDGRHLPTGLVRQWGARGSWRFHFSGFKVLWAVS